MAIQTQAVSATIADTEAGIDVTLTTPVPTGTAFPLVSARGGSGADARDQAVRAILQTIVDGEYTEIRFERDLSSDGAVEVDGHVLWGPELTVELVEGTHLAATGATDSATITAVDLSETFLVSYAGGGGPAIGQCTQRTRLASTTSISMFRGEVTGDLDYTIYVVSIDGATVEHKLVTITDAGGLFTDTSITEVTLAETFFVYSHTFVSASTNAARFFTEGRFTSTTNFRLQRDASSSGQDVEASVWIVSHPDLTVEQTASTALSEVASNTATISELADTSTRFLVPGNQWGNSRYNGPVGNEQDHGATTHEFTSSTEITFTRAATDDTATVTGQAAEFVAEEGGGPLLESNLLRSPLLHSRLIRRA